MSETSTNLALPFLASGQAQKHVTVNESVLRLDALVQLAVVSASVSAQPGSPSDGQIYILPTGKTGSAWGAMTVGALAYYRDGAWEQITPREGFRAWVKDTNELLLYNGSAWGSLWVENSRKLLFTPGGDGAVSIYRMDTTRVQNPRTAVISSIATDTITLTTTDAGLFFNSAMMAGVSYVRIWNTSKTPDQSAWVKAQPANNQLQVLSAAALSGWAGGETIEIGDPTDQTPNRFIALDISPMLQSVLGRVFRQAGVLCKMLASGVGAQNKVDISENGAAGANQPLRSFTDGSINGAQNAIPCSVLSPVSNSNLVFVQETATGSTVAIAGVNVVGVWV